MNCFRRGAVSRLGVAVGAKRESTRNASGMGCLRKAYVNHLPEISCSVSRGHEVISKVTRN